MVVPVNVRPYLKEPVDQSFAYYAGAVRLELEYADSKLFWENAQRVHHEIQTKLKQHKFFNGQKITLFDPTFIDSFSFAKYGLVHDNQVTKLIAKMGIDRISVGLTVSNLGKLDFPVASNEFCLHQVYGPITFSDTIEKYIGVVTCNGSLSFTFNAIEKLGLEKMFKIRDTANKHFIEAIGENEKDWDGLLKQE